MAADFKISDDLTGTQFRRVNLSGSVFQLARMGDVEFRGCEFAGTRFRIIEMDGVTLRGVELNNVEISGDIGNLTINGVEVAGLVEAELDRRYPERVMMRPTDAAGYRQAWDVMTELWDGTVQRARRLDPELLHKSVDGKWSFIQTLRHLVLVTDGWTADSPRRLVPVAPPRPAVGRPGRDTAVAGRHYSRS